jgi:predicted acyltransferase
VSKPVRFLSLDVFRGLTVAAMVLVNNPGDFAHVYSPLEHAAWDGCTPTDLIFPFFIFIIGVSIAFSLETKKANPENHSTLILKAFRRSLILFGLGLFLALFPKFDFSTVRIMRVLQRIAVVFFVCAILYIKSGRKFQLRLFWTLLAGYYIIMVFVPVPGLGHSSLMPETNMGAWLDRTLLTPAHLYKQAKTWDPEGLLSTIPAISTCIFGMLIGTWLKRKDKVESEKIVWDVLYWNDCCNWWFNMELLISY